LAILGTEVAITCTSEIKVMKTTAVDVNLSEGNAAVLEFLGRNRGQVVGINAALVYNKPTTVCDV
jgi:hypothetical protein